ncbi:metal-dependent hydrolase, beta-lactamase superfamily III [Saccharomonospora marina XMU15]|uniref:Metal-dependent hydrolase, beta-lactamase superfamily III n=1 Tax=Saccharomonospora marina XMU15 TaxID=882083 RepID=H5X063_9PSEU|nr:MBL fold metallo-hydrolase [Saccharomonospora marina]EHR53059.1 metal-dependent hydrolase, beta-lactamase superfamily III [Saccharomonospora marina XMU15]
MTGSSTPAADHRTRLVLLGTAGGPGWHAAGGAGISSALAVGDRYYLIDAGHGVARQLRLSGLGSPGRTGPLDALRGIFITHLHSDHVVDLNNLLNPGLFNGLDAIEDGPLVVWGPGNRGVLPPAFGSGEEPPVVAADNPTPGMRETVELLTRAFATDFNDRARDNRRKVPSQLFEGRDVPVPPQFLSDPNGDPAPRMRPFTFFEDDHVRVSGTLVDHAPVFPALAFRFDTDDGSVVFSGDTCPCDNLVELATDADVLVHEVIDGVAIERAAPERRTPEQEAVLRHVLGAHTTIEQVGPLAERAGVRTLVLNHFVPVSTPPSRWLDAGRGYSGRVVVGRDLEQLGVGK